MKEEAGSDRGEASGAYVDCKTPTPHDSREDVESGRDTADKDEFSHGGSAHIVDVPQRAWHRRWVNKGSVSNSITFCVFVASLLALVTTESSFVKYPLAAGLFGFAGGVTNWLAVKMLFDRIPLLYGSGVIPNKFREIRAAVKDMVLRMFFEPRFLRHYLREHGPALVRSMRLAEQIQRILEDPDTEALMREKLQEVADSPTQAGSMLNMVANMVGGVNAMVPYIKPMLVKFAADMADQLPDHINFASDENVDLLRVRVDDLLTDKLQFLTPQAVKRLMEDVIREHLGWLIVWGNVFGGLIGLAAQIVGYGL